jgi:hypothetical protein
MKVAVLDIRNRHRKRQSAVGLVPEVAVTIESEVNLSANMFTQRSGESLDGHGWALVVFIMLLPEVS